MKRDKSIRIQLGASKAFENHDCFIHVLAPKHDRWRFSLLIIVPVALRRMAVEQVEGVFFPCQRHPTSAHVEEEKLVPSSIDDQLSQVVSCSDSASTVLNLYIKGDVIKFQLAAEVSQMVDVEISGQLRLQEADRLVDV